MKPRIKHKEAMEFSFKAKQALDEKQFQLAKDLYQKAAILESEVAEFYFDKPELEPTRSILIRSAAFLNLKAGEVEIAQKFIFFGLLNIKDDKIKAELNDALAISVSLKNNTGYFQHATEYNYLSELRNRSLNYSIENTNTIFGQSVSLNNIRFFSENYLKSLRAYAITKFKRLRQYNDDLNEEIKKTVDKVIDPLITNTEYGSFRFSIANDFIPREIDDIDVVEIKSNILDDFHEEIFINDLSDRDISVLKERYTEDEINDIFRPLTKIKSSNIGFRISYFDSKSFSKHFIPRIDNKQKRKLLTVLPSEQEDIGELLSQIVHQKSSGKGRLHKKTLLSKRFKSFDTDIELDTISPKDKDPIILSEVIEVNMKFSSDSGFTISFKELEVQYTDIDYYKTLEGFYTEFYNKMLSIIKIPSKIKNGKRFSGVIRKIIVNPDHFLK